MGRFDIAVHVMTMSRFRQQPRLGHLARLKRIIHYLVIFSRGSLRFSTHEPDYSNLPHNEYDWQRTVYSGAKVPLDIPETKGKHVTTTAYVDANLHHDQVMGRPVTTCLHFVKASHTLGIPKGKLQSKLQLLGLNLWQPALLQTRSSTSGTPSCILEFQSEQKATCLVITNLWLTVQVFPPLPYPRNPLWLPTIKSEKPLQQDIFKSTGKMESPTPQTS